MKTEDVVKLAKKHLASVNGSRVTFGVQQLIALIAEVQQRVAQFYSGPDGPLRG